MKEQYRCAINQLRRSIERVDKESATAAAKKLTDIKEQFYIRAQPPVLYYHRDTDTESDCTAIAIHFLYIGEEKIAEWSRQSIGGIGLDRNHPNTWAAVAIEPRMSLYGLVVKTVLQILDLQDHVPSIPRAD